MIRVALVDDQQLVRAGFRMVIDSQDDLQVVVQASDGAEAVRVLSDVQVDVVLMDVRMPRMDGIEATRQITALPSSPRVIVLTTFDLDEYVVSAIGAGASGFLLKDAPPEEMLAAVRTVHAGDAVIGASSTRRLLRHIGPMLGGSADPEATAGSRGLTGASVAQPAVPRPSPSILTELTPREHEVFALMASGMSNAEIATALFVSEATVKTHVGRVLTKTGARDRVQVVVLGYQLGIVEP
ncbi:MAG TPA: response regulator transcription factor [Kineosporiaceae bacterium]|nr:response regulator transcription factor [Kineosporiaceae bacterium]